ncbi:hypothetical protein JTE90_014609 [Oedothorax gibbosus]|uniref:Uncharacterized protein n=1 Tax=Oedothorax gibbosus TaxID=931172 RepID=A0AAV6V885_9ARAC|nr:hypothetical protein JTE90_014609 [Oedothorax gibbosus]
MRMICIVVLEVLREVKPNGGDKNEEWFEVLLLSDPQDLPRGSLQNKIKRVFRLKMLLREVIDLYPPDDRKDIDSI